MAMEFLADLYGPGNQLGVNPSHAFTGAKRLFIFRRPYQDIDPADLTAPQYISASRAHDMMQTFLSQQGEFARLLLPAEIIELDTAAEPEAMAAEFPKHDISASDAVIWSGGDGTHSNGGEAADIAGFKGLNKLVGLGNARDLAHMLFTKLDLQNPVLAMARSREAPLYPVTMTISQPESSTATQTIKCRGYGSFGEVLYDMAKKVSSDTNRIETATMSESRKLLRESNQTRQTLLSAQAQPGKRLIIEDNDGRRMVSDIVFTNGSRMAKIIRFGGMSLLQPGYGRIELPRPTISAVASTFGKAAAGRFPHHLPEDEYQCRLWTVEGSPVPAQRDGETFQIESGSELTITISQQSQRYATTREVA